MALIPLQVRIVIPLSFARVTDMNPITATRFSSQLKGTFGINVSQIELLGSMTIGTLDGIIAKSQTIGSNSGPAAPLDGGSVKYGETPVPILNGRLVYGEPYTTDASPHQRRTWLAQVSHPTPSITRSYTFPIDGVRTL